MSSSENRRQYLAWIRTNFPSLYNATVMKTVDNHLAKQKQLGYLGDDFSDFSSVSSTPDLLTPMIDTSSISSNSSSLFDSILNSVTQLGSTYLSTDAQVQLLNINTARAKQGLPPLTYLNGQQVTAAGLAPANSSVNGLESALSSVPSPLFWLIGGGLGLWAVSKALGSRRS